MKWSNISVLTVCLLVVVASFAGSYALISSNTSTTMAFATVTTTTSVEHVVSLTYTTAVTTVSSIQNGSTMAFNPMLIYNESIPAVVTVQGSRLVTTPFGTSVQSNLGSGFVVGYNGSFYVVTNYHVVQGDSNLTVTFFDGNSFRATPKGSDPYSDLAVLSILSAPSSEFHPLSLFPSSSVSIGQPVLAIGSPYGLSSSVSFGIVSQLGRTLQEAAAGNFSIASVIQFSAPINPGNSGGPLIASDGKVIGITTAVVGGSQGLGFAIPSDSIIRELPFLISQGSYNFHSYLGIMGTDMSYWLSQLLGVNITYGVLVAQIVQEGPASLGGILGGNYTGTIAGQRYILGGDIIISINGTKILNNDYLSAYLDQKTLPNQTVVIGIIRHASLITLRIQLGVRPPPS